MDEQTKTTEMARQFAAAEHVRQADPAPSGSRQSFAAEAAAKEARAADAALTTDGQLHEAGYGHGV